MSSGADIYHEMIVDYSRNTINYGEIEDHDVTFHDSNPLCGDSIDIDMKIDDHKVTDIKFHGKGCAICMACTSVLTEITKGKSLDDVKKIETTAACITATKAATATITVKSSSSTVTNAEVLKSIVALIASINKQIQALQKLILKR